MKCIVYNVENPESKDFVLGCNGIMVQGQCNVEINLKEEYIHILENACISTPMVTSDKKLVLDKSGRPQMEEVPRFRIVKLELTSKSETPKKAGRPRKEEETEE